MRGRTRLIARIGLFAALIYVLSWGTASLPNVKLSFFIIFSAGYLWGFIPGVLVGAIGMGLWTEFNPYGPAPIPIALAQIFGGALCGMVGFAFRPLINPVKLNWHSYALLIAAGFICTVLFFVSVNLVDAWLFQPFRERFIAGMIFSLGALVGNVIIFPLLFGLLHPFYVRERSQT
jgi:hypothetical protein